MFSNINEAWDHDPVREMTKKLSNGNFKTQTSHADMFNFKNKTNTACDLSISEGSVSLYSDDKNIASSNRNDTARWDNSDYSSFAPINFKKNKHSKNQDYSLGLSDIVTSDSNLSSEPVNPKCSYSIRHLKKCNQCYDQLKKLIDKKVNKKFNDMVLDEKMKQIKSMNINNISNMSAQNNQTQNKNSGLSDSWKETLIIITGAVIAIFLIFLIVRSLK